MLRILMLLLATLPVLANSASDLVLTQPQPVNNGLVLSLDFPEPQLLDVSGGTQARLAGEGLMGVAGCPDLPAVIRHIRIPNRSGVSLDLREAVWTNVGQVDIAPMQDRLHVPEDLPLPWIQDETVYGTAAPWPTQWLKVSEPMLLREVRLVTLTVAPLRWNPVSGELQRLEHLTVQINFEGSSDVNVPLREDEDGLSDDSEGLVYHYQAAEDQYTRQMLGAHLLDPVTGESWGEAGSLDEITWSTPALPLNYLVIAKNAAINQAGFVAWLEWKRRKGHHVVVLSETQIPSWNASSIRTAILNEYNNNALYPPHYVMLVGDPTDGSYVLPTHDSQYDHYYAAIVGSDILADVVVGRISVTSAAQLNTVMNKVVGYEQGPFLDNPSWLRRASFLTGSGHCGESMSQLARDFGFQLMQERGYTQIDTAFCANSPSYVYNWFNQGISHYNYRGWIGMEGLSTDQLIALQQGPRTPIAVVFTCSSGEFYQNENWGTAYTEAFLRGGTTNTPGGAAAAMGFCTSQTHTAYNNLVDGGFWSALLDYHIPQVGTCMFRGKLELFNTLPNGDGNINNFSWWANLMGDPGMEQWCGVPEVMHFESVAEELSTAAQVLELRVLNAENAPMAGVAVCAWQSGDVAIRGLTDADGRVQLSLPAYPDGTLKLTATKAFTSPALLNVRVVSTAAAPVLQGFSVADANADGLLVPGETFTLQLTLANASTSESLPALALSSEAVDADAVTILDGSADVAALGPMGVTELVDQLQFTVQSGWTEGLPLKLNLRLSAGEQHYLLRAELPISTPALEIRSSSWATTALYPGETRNWELRVENTGTLTGHNLHLVPTFADGSGITVTPENVTLDSLAVGQTLTVTLAVSAAANLVPGYTSPLYLLWGDESLGCNGLLTTGLTLGNRLVTDPTGPDAHGYYAFESTDTQWLQSPTYSWVEIAPSAGGTGTVINLHDNADEADDSRRVELPFPFTVYGETYTSLAVCSNGFVAFGPLAHLQADFRNHFLPCGMGPEPMLAPMWDDLKLSGDAQVCTQYLPALHVFVIEWYRMRTNSNSAINTFQILLYDPALYPTPTGDGEFVYQYLTFTDTQNNDQDFPYCTVGMKNQDATVGLTLLNYHERPSTAAAFGTGKAIRFSTSIGLNIDPSQLNLSASELAFNVSESVEETATDSLMISNTGVAPLIWHASVLPDDAWPPSLPGPGLRDSGGPDSFGYTWIDSDEEQGPTAGWVDVWEAGTELSFGDEDTTAAPITLPFSFPFYGGQETQLWVHSNGFVSFADPVNNYYQNNVTIPGNNAPAKTLMVEWDDLMNDGDTAGYVRYWTNNADSVVVTYNAVVHNNPVSFGGPFTFQVVLESNGRITYNYGEMSEEDIDSDSGTIAVQFNSTTGFVMRHMQPTRDNLTIQIVPPYWLTLGTSTGAVPSGEEQSLVMHARNDLQGQVLPQGDYTATVELRSNDPAQSTVLIPVILHVGDVSLDPAAQPRSFSLGQAVPNPFNPTTSFSFQLPEAARVQANLYNVAGQYVGTVLNENLAAGSHSLRVDGSRLASGVYLLKVEAGSHSAVRKLTLLK